MTNEEIVKASMTASQMTEKSHSTSAAFTAINQTKDEEATHPDADANFRHQSKPPRISSTKQMEKVTRREALHHTDMAWSAQQRLMRRCLQLRFVQDDEEEKRVIGTDGNLHVLDEGRQVQK